jgi:hypothetical protein
LLDLTTRFWSPQIIITSYQYFFALTHL